MCEPDDNRGTSRRPNGCCYLIFGLVMLLAFAPGMSAKTPLSEQKPFAEHFLVLQLSDADPDKQALVLSVARNLLEHYGVDRIAVEVVAFGPGVHLLYADSQYAEQVDSLAAQGVRFDVCMNTIDTIARETGKKPDLNSHSIPVQVGVARILELTDKGYTLVRP